MWFWARCLPQAEPLLVAVTGNGGRDSSDDAKWTGQMERYEWTGPQHRARAPGFFVSLEHVFGGFFLWLVILTARRWPPALTSIYLMGTRLLPHHGGRGHLISQLQAVTPTMRVPAFSAGSMLPEGFTRTKPNGLP